MNRWAKLSIIASFSLIPAYLSSAQAAGATPEIPTAKYQFLGEVNKATQVYSGAGDNYYPTLKVDKGASVTVVGVKNDWLKIVPPDGSFSVVAKAFVSKADDGTGTITGDNVNVRAGSSLQQQKTTIQCKLQHGDKVQIVGDIDEYYMIRPPEGAFLFVRQDLVDPVKKIGENPVVIAKGPETQPAKVDQVTPASVETRDQKIESPVIIEPRVDLAAQAKGRLQNLEIEAKNAEGLTLADRPYPELIASYSDLLKSNLLSGFDKQLAEARLTMLNMKNQNRSEFLRMQAELDKGSDQLAKVRDERARIDQKLDRGITLFSAVGTLQTSTLQNTPGQTVYRLTDPTTGRTICYVRTSDTNMGDLINTFVGVDGPIVTDADMTLKIVNVTKIVTLDPQKINNGVTAQLLPTSMLPKSSNPTATTAEPH